jgi:hypothetical protein
LSETPFLEVSGKTVAIPKELQSFNEPGLKPDRPKEGEKRQRLQRRTFDAADSATKVQTKPEARKKSNRKKGERQKKRKKHKKESASHTPASKAVSLPVTPSNVTNDLLRQLQQGGGPLQALFPAGFGASGTGQQVVIQNLNVFVLPDPKK